MGAEMFSVTPKNKRPRQSPEPVADRESPVHGNYFTGYDTVNQLDVSPAYAKSIIEDAALAWFGELGYAVGHGPQLAPGEYAGSTLTPTLSHGERDSYGEVVLVGRLREAIRRLNPEPTVKVSLSVQTKEPQP